MKLPNYEWVNSGPPELDRTKSKGTTRRRWSYLFGIADSKPGKWLRTKATPNVASTLKKEKGYEAVYRDGYVYLRRRVATKR